MFEIKKESLLSQIFTPICYIWVDVHIAKQDAETYFQACPSDKL